jgi:drug/metabolite transporter (DMT)-like permease
LEADSIASLSLNAEAIADLVALLSALFFGIHPLIIEQLRQRLDSLTIMTWSSVSSSLVLLPFTLLTTEGSLFPVSETGWLTVGALALIGQMLGVGLWTYCLKKLSSAFASLVALLIPSLSAIEGWLIFKEALDWLTLVSFIVVLFGMYLAISSQSSTTQTSKNPE